MSYRIEITLLDSGYNAIWARTHTLPPEDAETLEGCHLEPDQLKDLVLGCVKDYVTAELL